MSNYQVPDYSDRLQNLMEKAGISSKKELAEKAGIYELELNRINRGLVMKTRVEILLKISQALGISLTEIITTFSEEKILTEKPDTNRLGDLEKEYRRLETKIQQQREILMQEFQESTLNAIESWLIQWPTITAKVKENPEISATRLLPLVKPLQQLLQNWGVEAIAPVGAEIPYNPQLHDLMQGNAEPGEIVKVRYTGYKQGNKLLWRAKVNPI